MKNTLIGLRIMGISGILGGLLLFVGDMLFYYDPVVTNLKQNMGNATDNRIVISGITALVASWLYMLGLVPIYKAFTPAKLFFRNAVVACFAAIFIAYGVIHAAYLAIATTAKLSVEYQLDMEKATALATKTNQILRWWVYPIFAVLSYLFISQVWKRKTLYPRWIIFFFPLLPFLLQGFVGKILSGGAWVIVIGGYLNLILVLFFTASTVALWKR